MPDGPEKLHADALAGLATTLRADPAVSKLVPDLVFTDPAAAAGYARCVVLTPGGRLGPPPGATPLLVQRDVNVEVRAESPAVFELLMGAVVAAGMGPPGRGATGSYHSANHQDSGEQVEADGGVSRTDLFCLVVRQPAAVAPEPPPPPAKGLRAGAPGGTVEPPRLIVPPAPPAPPPPQKKTPPKE